MKYWKCVLVIAGVSFSGLSFSASQFSNGNCASYDLSSWVGDTDTKRVTVTDNRAKLFQDEYGDQEANAVLKFGQSLKLLGVKKGMGRVLAKDNQRGWVKLDQLLCGNVPLEHKSTGLSRKAFIRTTSKDITNNRERQVKVLSFPNPDLKSCSKDKNKKNACRRLSRFSLTYVFDESEHAVLLGSEYNHQPNRHRLFGWVYKKNVIMWDHAGGLRGKDDLTYNGSVGTVCGYPSLGAAKSRDKSQCQPILGGQSWYKSPWRLPILEDPVGGYYRVAAATNGFAGGESNNGTISLVNPEKNTQPLVDFANNIDVFFVMDGTLSMTPQIERIRGSNDMNGVVGRIKSSLQEKAEQGAQYRFGFRMYTDTQNGLSGIGEGVALEGTGCKDLDEASLARNNQRFLRAISEVRAISDKKDDYPENIWGGVKQAIRDASGCRDNIKLMFIIGDAGYDANMQSNRGLSPVSLRRLAKDINRRNMALFFLRPPLSRNNTNPAYKASWNSFKTQSIELLKQLDLQKDNPHDYFIDLNKENDTVTDEIILSRVNAISKPESINELKLDISGGAALLEAVERLQGEGNDVPVLLWNMIKKQACKKGRKACDTRIIQTVRELFVPISDDVQEDVWLLDRDFSNWNNILGGLRADVPGREKRLSLVNTLITSLENTLNVNYQDVAVAGESFAQFVKRVKGLPVRLRSPLMSYSPEELKDPSQVPLCEIESLVDWAQKSLELLSVVRVGYNKPDYLMLPPVACDDISLKGKKIPFIPGISTMPLGPNKKYNYSQRSGGERRYWVPVEFMP
jgi:hypothetical protein